jgi:bifunctional non-homologous end joining protein LigD
MNTTTTTTEHSHTSLYFREGSANKEYHAAIQEQGDGFIVRFSYGRRGSTLAHGTKTTTPVPLIEAHRIYHKLVASKIAKGYQELGARVDTSAQTQECEGRTIWNSDGTDGPCLICPPPAESIEGRDTGIRCQLLNPADPCELGRLLANHTHCLQEKHDGRRVLVRKLGNRITSINRRGLVIALSDGIRHAVAAIPGEFLIDGEAVGETLHAFDLLELDGKDLRILGYLDRYRHLLLLLADSPHRGIIPVRCALTPADKLAMYKNCRALDCEGVVFKEVDAPASAGRPNSGGAQLKYKFVESASFVVTACNAKRSVALGLYDSDVFPGHGPKLVFAGNVTIPPNHAVPAIGEVVEVKYLYAFPESGSVYQPVYAGKRCDIPGSDCLKTQLKYKAEAA